MKLSLLTDDAFIEGGAYSVVRYYQGDIEVRRCNRKIAARKVGERLFVTRGVSPRGIYHNVVVGNVSVSPIELRHFASLAFVRDGEIVHVPRYHDAEYEDFSMEYLLKWLGETEVSSLFPIGIDISSLIEGDGKLGRFEIGIIPAGERLTPGQIVDMALDS